MTTELNVDRKELKDALKKIRLADKKFSVGEAVLSFKEGWLELQTQGVSVQIAATGIWPGKARVCLRSLRPLYLLPPKDNPLTICFRDDHLRVGSYSVPAKWEDISPQAPLIAMDLSWVEVLKLRYYHTEAALISGGMGPKIAEAEEKLKARIVKAAKCLKETGITEKDLFDLVNRRLQEIKHKKIRS